MAREKQGADSWSQLRRVAAEKIPTVVAAAGVKTCALRENSVANQESRGGATVRAMDEVGDVTVVRRMAAANRCIVADGGGGADGTVKRSRTHLSVER